MVSETTKILMISSITPQGITEQELEHEVDEMENTRVTEIFVRKASMVILKMSETFYINSHCK